MNLKPIIEDNPEITNPRKLILCKSVKVAILHNWQANGVIRATAPKEQI